MAGSSTLPKGFLRVAALAASLLPFAACADKLADRIIIVYNAADPDSRPLADYYAQKRGVPTNQICGIRAPVAETITRQDYNEKIRDPVWRFLTENGFLQQEARSIIDPVLGKIPWLATVGSKVSYVVLMYGVPLRIDEDSSVAERMPTNTPSQFRRNEASVESELTLIPRVGVQIWGYQRNPFFESGSGQFGPPLNQQMLLVGRLDGPDPQTVRRMIDDALKVERSGLHGRAYFDLRGAQDKSYIAQGDAWIRTAYRAFRDAGYECDFDTRSETFDRDYPMTDVAIYAGWYAGSVDGPFLREDFRSKTGAVAYHLHSFSGISVRTRTAYWVGPLLAKGAAAAMGNVFEPYFSLTPHIDVFFQRLLDGSPFLEAGYYSEPVLSWQTTFVGDPLYRPFALSLNEQIERLEAAHDPDVEWTYLRQVNLLTANGEPVEAETLCRTKAEALGSKVLHEKLGDILHGDHREAAAVDAYRKVIQKMEESSYQFIRVATKLAGAYEANRQPAPALKLYEDLIQAHPTNHNLIEFYKRARDLAHASGNSPKAKLFQAKIDELLKAQQGEASKKK